MTIYAEKRSGKPTGAWIVEVTRDGKRTRTRTHTMREAQELEKRIIEGQPIAPEGRIIGIKPSALKSGSSGQLSLSWLVSQSGKIWKDCRDDQSARRFEVAAREIGLDMPIDKITRATLNALKERLIAIPARRRITNRTLNRYLSAVSAALRWAHENEFLSVMPSIPWEKTDEFVATYYTDDEERAVIEWLIEVQQPDVALVIRVYATTGLRADELLSLTPQAVAGGWITVGTAEDRTKNGTVRWVPIDPRLEDPLRDLLTRGVPSYRVVLKWLKRACVACGIDPRKTVHKLRHTAATRLSSEGVPTATVQHFLGHKTIQTTLKYVHTEPKALADAAKVLWKRGATAGQSAGQFDAFDPKPANPVSPKSLTSLHLGSGGGTRTPDTRIMIAVPDDDQSAND